jgi:hypothetical protein
MKHLGLRAERGSSGWPQRTLSAAGAVSLPDLMLLICHPDLMQDNPVNAHSWLVVLDSWIVQDGNYPDFVTGQRTDFALEFASRSGQAAAERRTFRVHTRKRGTCPCVGRCTNQCWVSSRLSGTRAARPKTRQRRGMQRLTSAPILVRCRSCCGIRLPAVSCHDGCPSPSGRHAGCT